MAQITLLTYIHAPVERCFDLARSIDLHTKSMQQTGERAVAGRTSGLIGPAETVTWEARHLGFTQRLTSKITAFDYPNTFTDEMQSGAFKSMKHHHYFDGLGDGRTLMKDVFIFESPLGPLGKLANALFLKRYMRNLLRQRNLVIKQAAEEPD